MLLIIRDGGVGDRAGPCRLFETSVEAGAAGVGWFELVSDMHTSPEYIGFTCVRLRLRPRGLFCASSAGTSDWPALEGPASGIYWVDWSYDGLYCC